MRIRIPFCAPFEIVGHRPGQPVGGTATNSANAPALRNYLPIKLRRRARPAWASQENIRPGPSENTQQAAVTVTLAAASPNIAAAGLEHAAEVIPAAPHGDDTAPAAAASLAAALPTLAQWVDEGLLEERSQRMDVARTFARCWANPHETEINIYYKAHLTSLPPIPPTVTKLEVFMCSSLLTPPVLEEGSQMQDLSFLACGSLQHAPDMSGCAGLKKLKLEDCVEMTTPPNISGCSHLTDLNFSGCVRLAALPDLAACPELDLLDMTDCRALTGTLDISSCPQMTTLFISGCSGINELELSRCNQLSSIYIRDCSSLRTLPSVGHLQNLMELELDGTPLTNLPEDIVSLPQDTQITLHADHFSDAVRNRLDHVMNSPDYDGPHIEYSMGEAFASVLAGRLDEEVNAWRNEAPEHLQQALTGFDWSAVPPGNNTDAFSIFLARVRETNDYSHASPALKVATQERIATLLNQLQNDPTLREQCFNLALEAVDTCGDRVALALMHMENVAVTSEASAAIDSGKYDNNPQALVDLCRAQYRLAIITEAANNKVATMHFTDAIEVHLGYITKLAEPCQLPVKIRTMLYPRCARVTDADIADVRKKLLNTGLSEEECAANTDAYHTSLAGSELMRKLLHRLRPADMSAVNADNAAMIEQAQHRVHAQMASLHPDAADYRQQSLQLKAAFHAIENDIPAQATLPLLHDFMTAQGIACGLDDAANDF